MRGLEISFSTFLVAALTKFAHMEGEDDSKATRSKLSIVKDGLWLKRNFLR
jgi:hypothetical protein